MDGHGISKNAMITLLCFFLVCAVLQGCFGDVPHFWNKSLSRSGSSIVFHLSGNVYPLKHFSASLKIGSSRRAFNLFVDTGSDLTWVECDYPCEGCVQPKDRRYKPQRNFDIVRCKDSLCAALPPSVKHPCKSLEDPCLFTYRYTGGSSASGVVVKDSFSLTLRNGTIISQPLAFGCAFDVHYSEERVSPFAGLLGLSNTEVSILTQLNRVTDIRNVVGHCPNAQGGGFLFFGADLDLPSEITWVPMSTGSSAGKNEAGPAELLRNGKLTGVRGLQELFDSGTTLTYFNGAAYETVLEQIKSDVKGKLTVIKGAEGLKTCWKGPKRLRSLDEKQGNVCLGIERDENELNVIGDISMQDTMVIYDNVNKQIGWIPGKCDKFMKP